MPGELALVRNRSAARGEHRCVVGKKTEETRGQAGVRVLRSLRLVFHTVKGHFRDIERKAGVSGAQVWVLSVVGDRPGIRLGELAKA
ncbi:MAG TPA: hypothetical protein VIE63_01245, partial [Ramlibacter sp.]